jgi:hypothetical protein
MNEKFSPELLEHKTHIVDCILEQIKEMASFELTDNSYPPTTLAFSLDTRPLPPQRSVLSG